MSMYELELKPESYETVLRALKWYHESLHMITDPVNYEPELPLEQLDMREKRVDIIRAHRLICKFEEYKND